MAKRGPSGHAWEDRRVLECHVVWICCGSPFLGIIRPQSLRVEGSGSKEQGSYGCGNNEDSPRDMTSVRQLNSIPEYVEHTGDGGKLLAGNYAKGYTRGKSGLGSRNILQTRTGREEEAFLGRKSFMLQSLEKTAKPG